MAYCQLLTSSSSRVYKPDFALVDRSNYGTGFHLQGLGVRLLARLPSVLLVPAEKATIWPWPLAALGLVVANCDRSAQHIFALPDSLLTGRPFALQYN